MEQKRKPLGVFDSGLGGLTVVKEILEHLPHEDIVFFGDTARVPYGSRSKETITEYVKEDIDFLLRYDVKAIVIACNTADSMARAEMEARFDLPIVGVVEPAAELAASVTKNGKIGVIGTKATIRSKAYEQTMAAVDPAIRVYSKACPLLVPLVEEGRFRKGDVVVESVLADYLTPLKAKEIDTLILGCTHYPLLRETIASILPDTRLIPSGTASTQALIGTLERFGLLSDNPSHGAIRYIVSDAPDRFAENGSKFLGREIHENVELVSVTEVPNG